MSKSCAAHNKLTDAIRSNYGFTSFCPGQIETLLSVAHGRDTFVCMPTGGCFSEGVIMIQVYTRLWPEPGPRTKLVSDSRSQHRDACT